LLDKYQISGDSDYYITVGSNVILISPKGSNNILTKSSQSSNSIDISINSLNDIANFIPDISKATIRQRIFKG